MIKDNSGARRISNDRGLLLYVFFAQLEIEKAYENII